MFRIIGEVEPVFVFAENVSRKAIQKAADDCKSLGYKAEALALSARDLGADHIRQRYWLLAHSNVRRQLRSGLNAETRELSDICPRVWASNPNEPGMVDGLAPRLDRIRAIGNGQVPVVAARAWRILTDQLNLTEK
jgi:DNA (cytosine-5)-methyltransferase 1